MMKTADPELMRAINTFHVLDTIRQNEPIARVEIAARTELSRATVSAITAALLQDELIAVRHVDAPDGVGRGRPRVMLALNPNAAYVAGVKLSVRQISVAVTNFRADVLATVQMPIRTERQPVEVVADLVEDGVRQCVSDAGLSMAQLDGLGIGLPGHIDGRSGTVLWSPIFGAVSVPLADLMQSRLNTRVTVDTDANLVALAENWFGQARGLASFAVVTVEDSVGMGLIVNGELYHGAHGMGAQFGHICLDPDGPLCRCGQRGCIDAYASTHALAEAAAPAANVIGLPTLAPAQSLGAVAERARDGESGAGAALLRAGDALGQGLATIIALLAPPKVLLSGNALRAGSILGDAILAAVERRVRPPLSAATEIVFHPWDDAAWARGAASLVLRQIYGSPWQAVREDRTAPANGDAVTVASTSQVSGTRTP